VFAARQKIAKRKRRAARLDCGVARTWFERTARGGGAAARGRLREERARAQCWQMPAKAPPPYNRLTCCVCDAICGILALGTLPVSCTVPRA